MVARNFIDIIDSWIKCLPTIKINPVYNFVSKRNHIFPSFLQNGIFSCFLILVFINIDRIIPAASTDLNTLTKYSVISLGVMYLVSKLGWSTGRYIENLIDEYQPLSYISLTKGDKKLVEETIGNNKVKLVKISLSVMGTLILGVIASIIANKISP